MAAHRIAVRERCAVARLYAADAVAQARQRVAGDPGRLSSHRAPVLELSPPRARPELATPRPARLGRGGQPDAAQAGKRDHGRRRRHDRPLPDLRRRDAVARRLVPALDLLRLAGELIAEFPTRSRQPPGAVPIAIRRFPAAHLGGELLARSASTRTQCSGCRRSSGGARSDLPQIGNGGDFGARGSCRLDLEVTERVDSQRSDERGPSTQVGQRGGIDVVVSERGRRRNGGARARCAGRGRTARTILVDHRRHTDDARSVPDGGLREDRPTCGCSARPLPPRSYSSVSLKVETIISDARG